jgi:hypothetical protein
MANESEQKSEDTSGGSTDEAIGRPEEWREGRYQRRGAPVDESVNKPEQDASHAPPPKHGRPVTRKDYE